MSEYPWDIENMMLAQHNQPCDCAICDEIHRTREIRKGRGAKCFLNNDGTSDCDRLRAEKERYEAVIKTARKITNTPDGNTLEETLNYTMTRLQAVENSLEEYRECVDKWRLWYDNASEDAKKWRADAQKFYGALQQIADYHGTTDEVWSNSMKAIAREALADRP